MADLTYAQAMQLAQSDLVKLLAMLLSSKQPDGTPIDTTGGASGDTSALATAIEAATLTTGAVGSLSPEVMTTHGPVVSTATLATPVTSSTTSQQLVAANPSRLGLIVVNTDENDARVKYGTPASASSFTVIIPAGATWTMDAPIYTGRLDILWDADGAGAAHVTEL